MPKMWVVSYSLEKTLHSPGLMQVLPANRYQALKKGEHFANSKVQEGGYLAEPMQSDQMNFLSAFAGLEADFVGIR